MRADVSPVAETAGVHNKQANEISACIIPASLANHIYQTEGFGNIWDIPATTLRLHTRPPIATLRPTRYGISDPLRTLSSSLPTRMVTVRRRVEQRGTLVSTNNHGGYSGSRPGCFAQATPRVATTRVHLNISTSIHPPLSQTWSGKGFTTPTTRLQGTRNLLTRAEANIIDKMP